MRETICILDYIKHINTGGFENELGRLRVYPNNGGR
jgi:hypothetical protein